MPSHGGSHTRRPVIDIGHARHERQKFSATVWIFVAFAPWIMYWVLSGTGMWKAAVASGLVASVILNGCRVRQREARAMEVVTLGFFAVHFTATVLLGSRFFCQYDAVLVSGTLAATAWGTLLAGSPFTYQYAREDWPQVYWNDPLFRRTNEIITAVWGLVFGFNTVLGVAGLLRPEARLWLATVLPNLGLATAIVFSVLFPRWYPRRVMEREILAREPYRWPAPVFGPQRPAGDAEDDVIVVGAGIGGLTAGALLARRGLKVLVLDQHRKAGGYCTSWERTVSENGRKARYTFDAGVHDISGLGTRGPVRSLLRQLGIEKRLNWHRMSHEYVLPGLSLKVPHRVGEFVALLGRHFPAERENLAAFFLEMEAVYRELYADVERTGGVPCPPRTAEEMLAYPRRHPHAFRWMKAPFVRMLDAYFSEPRLKQLLTLLASYLCDEPGTLTVGEIAPVYGYYFDGGYYPAGGSRRFADALADVVRECGSQVRLGTCFEMPYSPTAPAYGS
ncbi:MAG: NAD(P)-binding protein, partial [Desulfotomaculales bacterium]